ncbi:adenine deaminase [Acetanaerobacterium elongatum]|uniref:Adenine deaminase n=1 Tax=Acetanaerobacterium elongatum TaxID=258515 RepID=A0A1H0F229_9FIRM|nr:Adenine deaminase [Acetanaerobacterium elongatum]
MKYKPLWEVSKELGDVAMGRSSADLVIQNARLVNVYTGEVLENTGVAVKQGRIALVGDASAAIGGETVVFDAKGKILAPGFIDGHLHIESSMVTVGEYARLVVVHGTTSVFMDPHEIVNVTGLTGMKAMLEDGATTPLRVFATTPSCVPASPGLEHTGASITPDDITETMRWDGVAGLGEMMNYPGILNGDRDTLEKVNRTLMAGKPVTGHFPLDDTSAALNAYIAAGICCCHESTTAGQALAKMRLGMYAMIREGSAWDDLPQVIKAVTEHDIDTRLAVLVSDDLHADTLIERGHMDAIVRMAVAHGVKPVTAIQMATINAASCFGLERELGAIAPGRLADMVLLSDLETMRVEDVFIGGRHIAHNGSLLVPCGGYQYPDELLHTVKRSEKLSPDSFKVKAPKGITSVEVRAIGVQEGSVLTTQIMRELPVKNSFIELPEGEDICKVAVINRHQPAGGMSIGFVQGFGLLKGAVASTYAHDAHNLIVLGKSDEDMAYAANLLIECSGGMAAVENGKTLALFELPIAGLMSSLPAEKAAEKLHSLSEAWVHLGSKVMSPFMTMSLLPLVVIPEIRITDMGLVDVLKSDFVPLYTNSK